MIQLLQNHFPASSEVKTNSKTRGFILVRGTQVEMPFTFIHGSKPGKIILITAGVHGGEYHCFCIPICC